MAADYNIIIINTEKIRKKTVRPRKRRYIIEKQNKIVYFKIILKVRNIIISLFIVHIFTQNIFYANYEGVPWSYCT